MTVLEEIIFSPPSSFKILGLNDYKILTPLFLFGAFKQTRAQGTTQTHKSIPPSFPLPQDNVEKNNK